LENLKPVFRVGISAIEVVAEIVRVCPKIKKLTFYVYTPSPNLSERQKIRKDLSLSDLLFHNPTKEFFELEREKITVENLREIIGKLKKDSAISVMSKIKTEKEIYHLPMMDFFSADHLKIEELIRKIIKARGVILFSGRSYHYYGATLLNEKEWLNFLGDCLLSGLVEARYIGHLLKDQSATLRLSASVLKPSVPVVISAI